MSTLIRKALPALLLCALGLPALADEIQLKDGKKFYGVIVGYDNNMFKIKTDFGFVLVQKDKIASIVPNVTEASRGDAKPAAKRQNPPDADTPAKQWRATGAAGVQPTVEPAVEKTPRISNAAVRPEARQIDPAPKPVAPAIKTVPTGANTALASSAVPLGPPKEAEIPMIPEEVQGNLYTNHAYGFRMYKAPSWQLIDDATALPNAIVAMGTSNESTLMVIGHETSKQTLSLAASGVEKRLREVYENYRQISQKKTTVSGLPAVEYRYQGTADGHDWTGTLVVIARTGEVFTALGMTYADTDLIQIQENVISKAIASLDFNAK